jgi:hypothetical protein
MIIEKTLESKAKFALAFLGVYVLIISHLSNCHSARMARQIEEESINNSKGKLHDTH